MNENRKPRTTEIIAWTLVATLTIGGGAYLFTAKAEVAAASAQHDEDTSRLNVCLTDAKNAEKLAVETQAWADKAVDDGLEWINVKRYNTAVQRNAEYLDCK